MWQPIRVNGNMPFNTGNFLARVVAFMFGSTRILDALSVNDQKSGGRAATKVLSDLAN